jgi:hypothetical protein
MIRYVAGFCFFAGLAGAAPTAYDQVIAPILRARCTACHGETKQKAKLALHTWEALAKGGDSGPVVVPGRPADSELWKRLSLPLEAEDHMPPPDEPQLTPLERSAIERWIAGGASNTAGVESLPLTPELAAVIAKLPAPRGRTPTATLTAAEVEKLRAPLAATVAALQQKYPGALSYESRASAALHFTAAGLGRNFGDAELVELVSLAPQLERLNLAGAAITDRSAPVLAKFTALRVLQLGATEITDEFTPALASLAALERCSLNGTRITEHGLAPLKRLTALRALSLADTSIAPEAWRATGLPVIDAAAPEPPPPAK